MGIADVLKDNYINIKPYSINNIKALIGGAPFFPITGLHKVEAKYNQQQTRRFQSLNGAGTFARNINYSGIIDISVLDGSPCQIQIEALNELGIPFPIVVTDVGKVGSLVVATGCQLIQSPTWSRDIAPGINPFSFETTRIKIAHGAFLTQD